jgi:F0F1-type ATP synthase membrane subunit c/vacuolar-type H+-ATPase subunit K
MCAVVLSLVLVPVGVYALARNPALRTARQVGLIVVSALIGALPLLGMLSGGV